MGAKRALIVDDSKSARLFLARVLEKYDIDVDSAESAEAAIDYLSSNRPDVIFMDHLMPGMDGLQAVQHIKNDPRTATIPIMMYTSQEGELYLGQARALGAIGVLPKQIKPTDVSKVLYQLHLVPDRRTRRAVELHADQRARGRRRRRRPPPACSPSPSPTAASRAFRRAAPRAGRRRRHPDRPDHRGGARAAARILPQPAASAVARSLRARAAAAPCPRWLRGRRLQRSRSRSSAARCGGAACSYSRPHRTSGAAALCRRQRASPRATEPPASPPRPRPCRGPPRRGSNRRSLRCPVWRGGARRRAPGRHPPAPRTAW